MPSAPSWEQDLGWAGLRTAAQCTCCGSDLQGRVLCFLPRNGCVSVAPNPLGGGTGTPGPRGEPSRGTEYAPVFTPQTNTEQVSYSQ